MSKDEDGRVDLHCHSSASIGAIGAPPVIAEHYRNNGFRAFGLTEHDNFSSLEGAAEAAAAAGVEYVPGIEMSATVTDDVLGNRGVHLLGFFYEQTPALREHCDKVIGADEDMKREFLARLRQRGIADITEDELVSHIKVRFGAHDRWKRPLSNGPIGDLLIKRGVLPKDHSKTYRHCFSEICPDQKNEALPDARTACGILREAGATIILAHPLGGKPRTDYSAHAEKLRYWLENYVDGLEIFYATYALEHRRFLLSIVSELKRPFTGGSDSHAYDGEFGLSDAPYACVESLKEFRANGCCVGHPLPA